MLTHIYYNSMEERLLFWYNFCIQNGLDQKKDAVLLKNTVINKIPCTRFKSSEFYSLVLVCEIPRGTGIFCFDNN